MKKLLAIFFISTTLVFAGNYNNNQIGLDTVVGAVIGVAIGNQVGKGNGRDAAKVVGGLLGASIANNSRNSSSYNDDYNYRRSESYSRYNDDYYEDRYYERRVPSQVVVIYNDFDDRRYYGKHNHHRRGHDFRNNYRSERFYYERYSRR